MPDKQPAPRRTLGLYGPGGRTIRVLLTRDKSRILVQEYRAGRPRRLRSWPNSKNNRRVAKLWAKTYAETRELPYDPEQLTLSELWKSYKAAVFPRLRPKSQTNYTGRWRKWELFFGTSFFAEDIKGVDIDKFVAAQTCVPNQIHAILTIVKLVYRWAESRDLVDVNKLASYRFIAPKDQPPIVVDEYSPVEYKALLAKLSPASALDWRAWVALTIIGEQGVRTQAALHLRWEDIGPDTLTWRAAHDKTGSEWTQPIRVETRKALEVAFGRRPKSYCPWVIFGRGAKAPYTFQALWRQLRKAEDLAGIKHRPYRAMHGLRRKVVGDVFAATGSLELAGEFVNHRDVRETRGYLRDRGRRRQVAETLDRNETVTLPSEPTAVPDSDLATAGSATTSSEATGENRTHDHSESTQTTQPVNPSEIMHLDTESSASEPPK